jgi:hypothetical protein
MEDRTTQLKWVWATDAPAGFTWCCPDCQSWAALGGNAGYHASMSGHAVPSLVPREEAARLRADLAVADDVSAALGLVEYWLTQILGAADGRGRVGRMASSALRVIAGERDRLRAVEAPAVATAAALDRARQRVCAAAAKWRACGRPHRPDQVHCHAIAELLAALDRLAALESAE